MGPAPIWMIGWCLCDNAAATASWASVGLDCFLERTVVEPSALGQQVGVWQPTAFTMLAQDSRQYIMIVSMTTWLLHYCIGVHARVYLYLFVVGVASIIQVSWAPVYMQVCSLYRYCLIDISVHIEQTRCRVFTCARVCAVCSLSLGNKDGECQLVYGEQLPLDRRKDRDLICAFSIFWRGRECMWAYVCVYINTHTHNTWGTRMWPQGSGRETCRARRIQMD